MIESIRDLVYNFYCTMAHKFWVFCYCTRIAWKIFKRGITHDNAKLTYFEFMGYSKVVRKLKYLTYGSPEYKANLKLIAPIVEHHYKRSSHHPEYYKAAPDSSPTITDMNFLDLVEQMCDWKAAVKRTKDGNLEKSLDINMVRYNYLERDKWWYRKILKELE